MKSLNAPPAGISETTDKEIYFVSDTNFFCEDSASSRGFGSAVEMNKRIVENWNDLVEEDDIVLHLGDFCVEDNHVWARSIGHVLKGEVYLIGGDQDHRKWTHTKKSALLRPNVTSVGMQGKLKIEAVDSQSSLWLYLSHYPMLSWPEKEKYSFQLHGDTECSTTGQHLNVSLDATYALTNEYRPIHFRELAMFADRPKPSFQEL